MVNPSDSPSLLMDLPLRCHGPRRQIVTASIILISGIVAGAGGMMLFLEYHFFHEPPKPDIMSVKVSLEMQKTLNLTDKQTRQVMSVLFLEFSALDRIRLEHQNQMEQRHRTLTDELRKILTPPQFEAWLKEFQIRQQKTRGPFPPGPPPGTNPEPEP